MMLIRIIVILLLCCTQIGFSVAQPKTWSDVKNQVGTSTSQGSLTLTEDSDVTHIMSTEMLAAQGEKVRVFRIRVYFSSNQSAREEAYEVAGRIESSFPYLQRFVSYDNPYFKVSVGAFLSKLDAYIALKDVSKQFRSAFITSEMVEL